MYPAFDNDILKYQAEVSQEISKLNILAIPENEAGKIEITGAENINDGENKIIINVTAPDGVSKREYIINVYRRNEEEELAYIEKQNENSQKLEQAYEATKTSQTIENAENEENNKEEFQIENTKKVSNKTIIIIIIVVIIGAAIVYFIVKKYVRFSNK